MLRSKGPGSQAKPSGPKDHINKRISYKPWFLDPPLSWAAYIVYGIRHRVYSIRYRV